jgi:antitoxin (DNA-binding transcriptional repressor) of toxin-antitoxin stability system
VLITQRGTIIAKLSPVSHQSADAVDWASSPEVVRDRSDEHIVSSEFAAEILAEASGKW